MFTFLHTCVIMADMDTLIHDRKEYLKFLEYLPELENDEVYFLSLSARNKYLTDEERVEYDLGRTEMFSRQIAFDKDGIIHALNKMRADLDVRTTRNGSPMPEHCLVVYINVHPSSTLKAYRRFSEQMDRHYEEAFLGLRNGSEASDMWIPFRRITTNLMNHIQKATSRKLLVDVDIDGDDEKESRQLVQEVNDFLSAHGCGRMVVKTQGGFHVLVPSKYLGKEVPLFQKLQELDKQTSGEVKFNGNAMVPLPGTKQAGKLVTIDSWSR